MNKCVNISVLSGNVGSFHRSERRGEPVAYFTMASDMPVGGGRSITTWVHVNVYDRWLVELCSSKMLQGSSVLVQGQLMNRKDSKEGRELTELRAVEITILKQGGSNGGSSEVFEDEDYGDAGDGGMEQEG